MMNIINAPNMFNMLVPRHCGEALMLQGFLMTKEDWYLDETLCRVRYIWMSEDYMQINILCKIGPSSWTSDEQREEANQLMRNHPLFDSVEVVADDPVYLVYKYNMGNHVFPNGQRAQEALKESDDLAQIALAACKDNVRITENPFKLMKERMKEIEDGKRELPDAAKQLGGVIAQIIDRGKDINPN